MTATVVDHVTPHKGDWNSFKLGRLQSLCASCHNSVKQNVERHGFDRTIGADGMPIDKNHPCYRGTTRKPETEPPPPLDLKTLIS